MNKYFSNRFIYIICCLILVCGGISNLAAKTTIYKKTYQLRKSRPNSQKTSQKALSVREQEKRIARIMALINAESRSCALLLRALKIVLRTSQEDQRMQNEMRKTMEKLKMASRDHKVRAKRKKMRASIRGTHAPNLTTELNHLNFILNSVKNIKFRLNQIKRKSGLTRRTKANVKITLQKLQTSAQTKSNKAKMILRAYKKKYP